jgi:exodeoxyribonuclease X
VAAGARFADMLAWAEQPVLYRKMTFGKHRGELITALPRDYCDWLLRQPDMDEDIKYSVRESLK